MNTADQYPDTDYNPQSRYQDLDRFEPEFWKKKKLEDLSKEEWELLCDGCGKCCLTLAAVREKPRWLPKTCAYWLLDNGFGLPDWHPLLTRDADSVHRAGMSLKDRNVISETGINDYENHLVDWPDL